MWTPQELPSFHPHPFEIQNPCSEGERDLPEPHPAPPLATLSSFVLSAGLLSLLATRKSFSLPSSSAVPTSTTHPTPPQKEYLHFSNLGIAVMGELGFKKSVP